MKSFAVGALMAASSCILNFGRGVQGVEYNGDMQYFIADLGPTSPCHPLYDRGYTWITTSSNNEVDAILEGLVKAGFNGIRLPMWPDSDQVNGPDPSNESRDISREFCDQLNKDWV